MKEYSTNDELRQFIIDGLLWNFCCGMALNKGHKDAIKEKKEVKFEVGDYDVEFDQNTFGFNFCHRIYFARIIQTYPNGETVFIGDDDENEVINDVLKEFEKHLDIQKIKR